MKSSIFQIYEWNDLAPFKEGLDSDDLVQDECLGKLLGLFCDSIRAQQMTNYYLTLPEFKGKLVGFWEKKIDPEGPEAYDVDKAGFSMYTYEATQEELEREKIWYVDIPFYAKDKEPLDEEDPENYALRIMQEVYEQEDFLKDVDSEFYWLKRYAEELSYYCIVEDACAINTECSQDLRPSLFDEESNQCGFIYRLTHVLSCNHSPRDIGYFSSVEKAIAARDVVAQYNGFKDFTEDFRIEQYEINKPYWPYGYITKKVTYSD